MGASSASTMSISPTKTAPGQYNENTDQTSNPLIATAVPATAVPSPIADVEIGPIPCMSYALSAMCLPLLPLVGCGCFTVDAKTEAAVMHMGVLTSMEDQAGLHCAIPCGQRVKHVISLPHCSTCLTRSYGLIILSIATQVSV